MTSHLQGAAGSGAGAAAACAASSTSTQSQDGNSELARMVALMEKHRAGLGLVSKASLDALHEPNAKIRNQIVFHYQNEAQARALGAVVTASHVATLSLSEAMKQWIKLAGGHQKVSMSVSALESGEVLTTGFEGTVISCQGDESYLVRLNDIHNNDFTLRLRKGPELATIALFGREKEVCAWIGKTSLLPLNREEIQTSENGVHLRNIFSGTHKLFQLNKITKDRACADALAQLVVQMNQRLSQSQMELDAKQQG